jgi:hypothetical protein
MIIIIYLDQQSRILVALVNYVAVVFDFVDTFYTQVATSQRGRMAVRVMLADKNTQFFIPVSL